LLHPAPEILLTEGVGCLAHVFQVELRGSLGQDPAPTHGVFTVVAAYPSVRAQGVVGLRVHRLPSTLVVQHSHAATSQLVPPGGATRAHGEQAAARLV